MCMECYILHCMDSYASEVGTPCVVRLNKLLYMYRGGSGRLKVVKFTIYTYNEFRLGGNMYISICI